MPGNHEKGDNYRSFYGTFDEKMNNIGGFSGLEMSGKGGGGANMLTLAIVMTRICHCDEWYNFIIMLIYSVPQSTAHRALLV